MSDTRRHVSRRYLPPVHDPIELLNKPSSLRETQDPALDCCLAWCPEVSPHAPHPAPQSTPDTITGLFCH